MKTIYQGILFVAFLAVAIYGVGANKRRVCPRATRDVRRNGLDGEVRNDGQARK